MLRNGTLFANEREFPAVPRRVRSIYARVPTAEENRRTVLNGPLRNREVFYYVSNCNHTTPLEEDFVFGSHSFQIARAENRLRRAYDGDMHRFEYVSGIQNVRRAVFGNHFRIRAYWNFNRSASRLYGGVLGRSDRLFLQQLGDGLHAVGRAFGGDDGAHFRTRDERDSLKIQRRGLRKACDRMRSCAYVLYDRDQYHGTVLLLRGNRRFFGKGDGLYDERAWHGRDVLGVYPVPSVYQRTDLQQPFQLRALVSRRSLAERRQTAENSHRIRFA